MNYELRLENLKNFEDPEVFKEIEKIIQEIIDNKQIKDALKLINFLEEKAPFSQKELYSLLLIKLKFLTFSLLSELEILDFFKKNLKEILKFSQEDILEKIKSKIIGLPILERNGFKKELFLVLKEGVKKEKIEPKEVIFLVNYLKISSEEEPEEEILIKNEETLEQENPKETPLGQKIQEQTSVVEANSIRSKNTKTSEQEKIWKIIKAQKQKNTEAQLPQCGAQTNSKRPIFESLKPKTENIKFTHKLIGPIEELKNFTLNEFRKLGNTPLESVQKIEEKINILGKDSLLKKAEGIKAWQNSEINKLYLEIGRNSLEKNIPISKVIDEKIKNNLLTLTIDEFETITDLNKKLRF